MLSPQYQPREQLRGAESTIAWLAKNYAMLEDGGFHYLGGEPNTQGVEEWDGADLKILVVRLSTYDAMDGSMTHSLLAQNIRDSARKFNKKAFVDFAFLPPRKDYEMFMKNDIPVMLPLITKRHPKEFDQIWISHSLHLEQVNYPRMLIRSGIPLFKHWRFERDDIPILVWGGSHSIADEPTHGSLDGSSENSSMTDVVIIGDGEPAVERLIRVWFKQGPFGKTAEAKKRYIRACHDYHVPGFYEPDKYDHIYEQGRLVDIRPTEGHVAFPVKKAKVWNLDSVRTLEERVQWYSVSLGGTADVEIARGCGAHCTFCQEASISRPYRERSLGKVKEAAWASRYFQGALEINLFSFVWNQYSMIYPLAQWLLEKFGRCNLISNRLDMQAEDKYMARMAKTLGSMHLTVGLEGVSERMRNYLNKNLSHQQVMEGVRNIFEAGITELKMFMIVTGLENDEDIAEFNQLLEDLIGIRNEMNSSAAIRISFTPLFHCAKTVLQYGKSMTLAKLDERTLDPVVQKCRELGIGFRTSTKRSEVFLVQLTEQGDRRLTPLYVRSSIDDGFIYYGFVSKDIQEVWENRMKELGLDPMYYVGEKPKEYVFPWDHISVGLSNQYLWEVYQEVREFQEREYCVATLGKRGYCTSCQACETPLQIAQLTNRKMSDPVEDLSLFVRPLAKVNHIRFKVHVHEPYRTVPKKFYALSLGRALCQSSQFFMDHYNEVIASSRAGAASDGAKDWVYGDMLLDVSVDAQIREADLRAMIPEINTHCKGWHIVDVRVMREMESLSGACELALYEVEIPASDISFYDLDLRVDAYFAKKSVKIKKRVNAGRNIFKTEVVDLDKSDIVAVEAFFTGENNNRVIWSCNGKLNPYFTLEALLGGRAHNYRRYPAICRGYFKQGQKNAAADIFAVLSGTSNICTDCGSSIENESFSGKPYESVFGKRLCLSCDISRQPVAATANQQLLEGNRLYT